jgi:hypothetical protein
MVKFVPCANLQFCFRLDIIAAESHKVLITNYGSYDLTKKTVIMWFQRFQEEMEDGRSGRLLQLRNKESITHVCTYLIKPVFNHEERSGCPSEPLERT